MLVPSKSTAPGLGPTAKLPSCLPSLVRSLITVPALYSVTQISVPSKTRSLATMLRRLRTAFPSLARSSVKPNPSTSQNAYCPLPICLYRPPPVTQILAPVKDQVVSAVSHAEGPQHGPIVRTQL